MAERQVGKTGWAVRSQTQRRRPALRPLLNRMSNIQQGISKGRSERAQANPGGAAAGKGDSRTFPLDIRSSLAWHLDIDGSQDPVHKCRSTRETKLPKTQDTSAGCSVESAEHEAHNQQVLWAPTPGAVRGTVARRSSAMVARICRR